ncbi:11039_t:CDS:2 [Dentiscutata erythropus]|uniref:11039_t:CDS:1 n=1 Tax=Dentiscutata erythropus TaxID=1348616 RepID=A0A9N9P5D2_9GLOM|nr:11039_t:CDS:2 [Dentiscutata erythropus]
MPKLKSSGINFRTLSPIGSYIEIINYIQKYYRKVTAIYEDANHCKRTGFALVERVADVERYVNELESNKNDSDYCEFLAKPGTHQGLFELNEYIINIVNFVEKVSQIEGLASFESLNEIEQQFREFEKNFDEFADKNGYIASEIIEFLKAAKEIKEEQSINFYNIRNPLKPVFQSLPKNAEAFNIQDYKVTEENPPRGCNIKKWTNGKKHIAVKEIDMNKFHDYTAEQIGKQIDILRKLRRIPHIIEFYGTFTDKTKIYIVTEWLEYGNLKEYYEKFRPLNLEKKSINILISKDHKSKIANFGISRGFNEGTRNIDETIETIRYMAPEKLKKDYEYDFNCEIYR